MTDDLNLVLDLIIADVNPQMTPRGLVAALPDGGAFVDTYVKRNGQVWRVNVTGHVIQHVYKCVLCNLQGLLVLNNKLFIIYNRGKLAEVNIDNPNIVQVYQVPSIRRMVHTGSLSYHPSVITHPDLLLLADWNKGEIFSYNVTSNNKQVHLTGLGKPSSVSFMMYNSHLYYIVCERGRDQVLVYNSTWGLYKTLGGTRGSGDGQLRNPRSAIGLPDGSVVIIDRQNVRVSLFTIQGKFVRHLITQSDGLLNPSTMSISLPYLWLTDYQENPLYTNKLYRYKLY